MTEAIHIQPDGLTDVRPSKKITRRARIGMALAGTGFAGALLVGGILGTHVGSASAHASQQHAPLTRSVVNVETAPMSFTTATNANASYQDIARQAATYYGISPDLFVRQIQQESQFNPNAVSPAGAEGIAQFMPTTAANMGVNPWDPTNALYGGARLMSQLNQQFGGNYAQALAAYNAGPGAVQYAINAGGSNWYAYLPAETQNYVTVIMGW